MRSPARALLTWLGINHGEVHATQTACLAFASVRAALSRVPLHFNLLVVRLQLAS